MHAGAAAGHSRVMAPRTRIPPRQGGAATREEGKTFLYYALIVSYVVVLLDKLGVSPLVLPVLNKQYKIKKNEAKNALVVNHWSLIKTGRVRA